MRVLLTVAVGAGGFIAFLGTAGWGQQMPPCSIPPCSTSSTGSGRGIPPSSQPQQPMSPGVSESPDGPLNPQLERDQAKMRNMDRQKLLVADTERLLSLATELKTEVDKSSKDTLSLDVIKKADEIEKLAHTVKEKMKGS